MVKIIIDPKEPPVPIIKMTQGEIEKVAKFLYANTKGGFWGNRVYPKDSVEIIGKFILEITY